MTEESKPTIIHDNGSVRIVVQRYVRDDPDNRVWPISYEFRVERVFGPDHNGNQTWREVLGCRFLVDPAKARCWQEPRVWKDEGYALAGIAGEYVERYIREYEPGMQGNAVESETVAEGVNGILSKKSGRELVQEARRVYVQSNAENAMPYILAYLERMEERGRA